MTPRARVLAALRREPVDRVPVGSATSIVSMEVMEAVGVSFPQAHLDPESMATLAASAYTILGHDIIMPIFSVQHEAEALGCQVDWGRPDMMPEARARPARPGARPWRDAADIHIPTDFLDRPACRVALGALKLLRRRFAGEVAVMGKVFGPWTLAYHLFGTEQFLVDTILRAGEVRRILDTLKEVTVLFAAAQFEAGADALCLADHATGDLVSAQAYRDFLFPIHQELAQRIEGPVVLHICGDTHDMLPDIARTGFACFHYDTKVPAAKARQLAGEGLALMGGVNNPVTLASGDAERVRREVFAALDARIDIIGPECAVPLNAPLAGLRAIRDAADEYQRRSEAKEKRP
jgi:[methyl-Co(III) methanol-specific corrinoid protein]:coenzyme M methyltransferase